MIKVHATCVEWGGGAVLLRGPPGSGKSDLGLRLIDGGGRLVAVVLGGGTGRAMLMTRHQGVLSSVEVFDATAAPLPGFDQSEKFVF